MAGGLELLLAGSMRIFGIASPFGRSRGLGYQLSLDTRQTVGDEIGCSIRVDLAAPRSFPVCPPRAAAGTWVGLVAFGPEAVSLELSKFFRSSTESRHAISLVRIVAIALYPLIQGREFGWFAVARHENVSDKERRYAERRRITSAPPVAFASKRDKMGLPGSGNRSGERNQPTLGQFR